MGRLAVEWLDILSESRFPLKPGRFYFPICVFLVSNPTGIIGDIRHAICREQSCSQDMRGNTW
jgi:hypothetical protein